MKKRSCLAELNVGRTKERLHRKLVALNFVHKRFATEHGYEADPSHGEIAGLPPVDSLRTKLLDDMIAECVKATHPAVEDE